MLISLDHLAERYAKLVIFIADFIGVSEKQLVYGWIVLSTLAVAIPLGKIAVGVNAVVVLVLELPYMLFRAREEFAVRDYFRRIEGTADGYVISDTDRRQRVEVFLVVTCLSFRYYGEGLNEFWLILLIAKWILPLYLWSYMIWHGGGGKKVRLKDLVKAGLAKLRERFAPRPIPQPVPQPA